MIRGGFDEGDLKEGAGVLSGRGDLPGIYGY